MKKVILLLTVCSALFAADKVIISSWGDYPIATGEIINAKKEQGKDTKYMIPNGTKAEVVKWHKNYTTLSNPYAQIDMFDQSEVKILNGPLKGKNLLVAHTYIKLVD